MNPKLTASKEDGHIDSLPQMRAGRGGWKDCHEEANIRGGEKGAGRWGGGSKNTLRWWEVPWGRKKKHSPTCTQEHTQAHICTHEHTCVCTSTYVHAQTHTSTPEHTQAHTSTHKHAHSPQGRAGQQHLFQTQNEPQSEHRPPLGVQKP